MTVDARYTVDYVPFNTADTLPDSEWLSDLHTDSPVRLTQQLTSTRNLIKGRREIRRRNLQGLPRMLSQDAKSRRGKEAKKKEVLETSPA